MENHWGTCNIGTDDVEQVGYHLNQSEELQRGMVVFSVAQELFASYFRCVSSKKRQFIKEKRVEFKEWGWV